MNDAGLLGSDYSVILLDMSKFCESINEYALGGPEASSLIHDNLEAWKMFRTKLSGTETAPNFQPFANAMCSPSGGFLGWIEEDTDLKVVINNDQKPFYLMDMRKHLQQCVPLLLRVLFLILLIAFL